MWRTLGASVGNLLIFYLVYLVKNNYEEKCFESVREFVLNSSRFEVKKTYFITQLFLFQRCKLYYLLTGCVTDLKKNHSTRKLARKLILRITWIKMSINFTMKWSIKRCTKFSGFYIESKRFCDDLTNRKKIIIFVIQKNTFCQTYLSKKASLCMYNNRDEWITRWSGTPFNFGITSHNMAGCLC